MARRCRVCDVELIVGDTWTVSLQKEQRSICRECYNGLGRQRYRERHPPKDTPYPKCSVCGVELNDENWYPSNQKENHHICKSCHNKQGQRWKRANPEKRKAISTRGHRKEGHQPMNENRKCASFLGVYVAERVLSHVFKNVQRMPYNNPGFDFICGKGYKIDVKSACRGKNRNSWMFNIDHNTIADYFLFLAFDNRQNLNPMYAWLIPGDKLNHLKGTSISRSTIHKWDEHRSPIDRVVSCCEAMR